MLMKVARREDKNLEQGEAEAGPSRMRTAGKERRGETPGLEGQ